MYGNHQESFIRKYIFSTDHKWIGIQYGVTGLVFLLFGFVLMMIMRYQLAYNVNTGLEKDILSPDRSLTPEERTLLQSLIDSSYDQFVKAVAEGRKLSEEKVREFADGRVFTGAQAKELGLVDELGDENDARILAIKLADLDEKLQPITLGQPKKKLIGLLPGGKILSNLLEMINLEFCTNGQPLWLFRP